MHPDPLPHQPSVQIPDQAVSLVSLLLPSKCGGTWVTHSLAALGLDPRVEPAGQHHAIAATAGRFVFTFVRHPLAWYPSFWQYRHETAVREGGPSVERLREAAGGGTRRLTTAWWTGTAGRGRSPNS